MKKISNPKSTAIILVLLACISFGAAVTIGAQPKPNKIREAYEMGAQMGAAVYYAEAGQQQFPKIAADPVSKKIYDETLKGRTTGISRAKSTAQSVNQALTASNQIDLTQFSIFDGGAHETDAWTQAFKISNNLVAKLAQIDKTWGKAYALGFDAGSANANAAHNGENNRPAVVGFLTKLGDKAKTFGILKEENAALIISAKDPNTPISQTLPKLVALRNAYKEATLQIK